jgi:hypothetical protein
VKESVVFPSNFAKGRKLALMQLDKGRLTVMDIWQYNFQFVGNAGKFIQVFIRILLIHEH